VTEQDAGAPLVRRAREHDEAALHEVEHATWSSLSSPSPVPPVERPFLSAERGVVPDDVLVAELDGRVAGYVQVRAASAMPSHAHVQQVAGLAVHPRAQGRGVAAALLSAAVAKARSRGAARLTLRVLGHNAAARRAYERAGFEVEGVLRGEFVLDGAAVDDVLMAHRLSGP
jgi:ribosomal protein S18 acetylase RimI-like enzyme